MILILAFFVCAVVIDALFTISLLIIGLLVYNCKQHSLTALSSFPAFAFFTLSPLKYNTLASESSSYTELIICSNSTVKSSNNKGNSFFSISLLFVNV